MHVVVTEQCEAWVPPVFGIRGRPQDGDVSFNHNLYRSGELVHKAIEFRGAGGEQSITQARLCEVLGECLLEFGPVCISEVVPWL